MPKLPFTHYFSKFYVSKVGIQAVIMKKLLCSHSREFPDLGSGIRTI